MWSDKKPGMLRDFKYLVAAEMLRGIRIGMKPGMLSVVADIFGGFAQPV